MSQIADELRERALRYALRILAFCRQLPESHKTAQENRKRRKKRKNQLANSPTHEFTKSI